MNLVSGCVTDNKELTAKNLAVRVRYGHMGVGDFCKESAILKANFEDSKTSV